ncbi:MAG: alpha/beta hydrolase [Wenzhouxiangellaceae bacterium]
MQKPLNIALALLLLVAAGATRGEPMSAREAFELPQPEPDAVIRYGELARQFGELRMPEGEGPFGVAVIVHGGCWVSDYDHGYMAAFAEAVTDLGLATWTIGYRRVGEPGGGWPNTFLDAGAAVDFLPELASSYPLDVERVLAIGHSAGGQLALWLAGRARLPESSPLFTHDPQPIAGVLALAAAADLEYLSEQQTCGNAATRLMQGTPSERPRRYVEGSPVHLPPLHVPQALVNGELDETWSAPAERYFEAALAAGAPIERQVMPDAGHFELVAPESPNWQIVRTTLLELFDRISPASP